MISPHFHSFVLLVLLHMNVTIGCVFFLIPASVPKFSLYALESDNHACKDINGDLIAKTTENSIENIVSFKSVEIETAH